LLTSVDGLEADGGRLIERIDDIDAALKHVRNETGAHSVGGMSSKLDAARAAVHAGIEVVIANGRRPDQLLALANGGGRGTRIGASLASAP
jgi:glutamate 5-kinase